MRIQTSRKDWKRQEKSTQSSVSSTVEDHITGENCPNSLIYGLEEFEFGAFNNKTFSGMHKNLTSTRRGRHPLPNRMRIGCKSADSDRNKSELFVKFLPYVYSERT